jgi:putative endonuclease
MTEGAYLYILRCSDGSLYVGTTRSTLESRVAQHNAGTFKGYTESRRPVELIFSQWFERITDAIESERKLKKWSRAKKEAFICGDIAALQQLAKRKSPHPSRRAQQRAPQDEALSSPVNSGSEPIQELNQEFAVDPHGEEARLHGPGYSS